MSNLKDQLWVAKYAPTSFDETIMPDVIKAKMKDFVKTRNIPNLLFAGPPGTGKTTSAWSLLEELKVDKGDILFLNASDVNSIDAIRNIVRPFAMSMSINDELPIRFVFLDEADRLSPQAQDALKSLIEAAYGSARFIVTANHPKKISGPLHSRFQAFTLEKPPLEPILERVISILEAEEVSIESEDDLVNLIKENCTDIRKLIQLLQQNTVSKKGGKVLSVAIRNEEGGEIFQEYLRLLKSNDGKAMRNLVFTQFTDTDCYDFWTLMIDDVIRNSDEYEHVGSGIDNVIYHLNEGQKHHEFVGNKQLNVIGFSLAALL